MREHTWNERIVTAEAEQRYRKLLDLHAMTTDWLVELKIERPSHALSRGVSAEVAESLWMLESLSDQPLEALLDDTEVTDVIGTLERTVWAFQSWTLAKILEKSSEGQRTAAWDQIEQLCWRDGRQWLEARSKRIGPELRADRRALVVLLEQSPLSAHSGTESFLVKRATQSELWLELRACPHRIGFAEVKPIADDLCRAHAAWIRGLSYGLDPKPHYEYTSAQTEDERCQIRWSRER